jgi:deoxyinosine 3'endonuclease (endonuclease V)
MHSWTLDPIETAKVQIALRQRLVLRWDGHVVETMGGFDVNVGGNLARYISPGHLIDPAQSEKFVLDCCRGYRLPEPTRWAHKLATGEKLPMDQPRLV